MKVEEFPVNWAMEQIVLRGVRFYNPVDGRFISKDPMGFNAGDTNLYRYVGNHPTNGRDPSGNIELTYAGTALMAGMSAKLDSIGIQGVSAFKRSSGYNFFSYMNPNFNPFATDPVTGGLVSFAQWLNDRPPGSAEGWENWVPLYGSLKNSMASFADGRLGAGALWGAMTLLDGLLVGKLLTGMGRLATNGIRGMVQRAAAELAAEQVMAREAGWKYATNLGPGVAGETHLLTGEVTIADGLVGQELIETVRHERIHQMLTPTNQGRAIIRLISYNKSHLLKFAEEFLAELYGTGSVKQAWVLTRRPSYNIVMRRVAGEAGAYVATVVVGTGLSYQLGENVSDDVMRFAGLE